MKAIASLLCIGLHSNRISLNLFAMICHGPFIPLHRRWVLEVIS